jgi:hypothetical protein
MSKTHFISREYKHVARSGAENEPLLLTSPNNCIRIQALRVPGKGQADSPVPGQIKTVLQKENLPVLRQDAKFARESPALSYL